MPASFFSEFFPKTALGPDGQVCAAGPDGDGAGSQDTALLGKILQKLREIAESVKAKAALSPNLSQLNSTIDRVLGSGESVSPEMLSKLTVEMSKNYNQINDPSVLPLLRHYQENMSPFSGRGTSQEFLQRAIHYGARRTGRFLRGAFSNTPAQTVGEGSKGAGAFATGLFYNRPSGMAQGYTGSGTGSDDTQNTGGTVIQAINNQTYVIRQIAQHAELRADVRQKELLEAFKGAGGKGGSGIGDLIGGLATLFAGKKLLDLAKMLLPLLPGPIAKTASLAIAAYEAQQKAEEDNQKNLAEEDDAQKKFKGDPTGLKKWQEQRAKKKEAQSRHDKSNLFGLLGDDAGLEPIWKLKLKHRLGLLSPDEEDELKQRTAPGYIPGSYKFPIELEPEIQPSKDKITPGIPDNEVPGTSGKKPEGEKEAPGFLEKLFSFFKGGSQEDEKETPSGEINPVTNKKVLQIPEKPADYGGMLPSGNIWDYLFGTPQLSGTGGGLKNLLQGAGSFLGRLFDEKKKSDTDFEKGKGGAYAPIAPRQEPHITVHPKSQSEASPDGSVMLATVGSTAGLLDDTTKRIKETTTASNKSILDSTTEITKSISDTAIQVSTQIKDSTTNTVKALGDLLVELKDNVVKSLGETSDKIKEDIEGTWTSISTGMKDFVSSITKSAGETVSQVSEGIKESISGTISSISDTLKGYKDSTLSALDKTVEDISSSVKDSWNISKSKLQDFIESSSKLISDFPDQVSNFVGDAAKKTQDSVSKLTSNILESVSTTMSGISKEVGESVDEKINTITGTLKIYSDSAQTVLSSFLESTSKGLSDFKESTIDKLTDFVSSSSGKLTEGISSVSKSFGNAISEVQSVLGISLSSITDTLKNYKDSSLEMFGKTVEDISSSIKIFWDNSSSKLRNFIASVSKSVSDFPVEVSKSLTETFESVSKQVSEALTDKMKLVGDTFASYKDSAIGFLSSLLSDSTASLSGFKDNTLAKLNEFVTSIQTSVSGALVQVTSSVADTMSKGVTETSSAMASARDNAMSVLSSAVGDTLKGLTTFRENVMGSISGFVSSTSTAFTDFLSTATKGIGASISQRMSSLNESFSKINQSASSSLGSATEGLGSFATGVIDKIKEFLQPTPKVDTPAPEPPRPKPEPPQPQLPSMGERLRPGHGLTSIPPASPAPELPKTAEPPPKREIPPVPPESQMHSLPEQHKDESRSAIENKIRESAIRHGIDPEVALKVARSEGLGKYVGDRGSSFGPFQLHYGNVAGGGMKVGGLGDEFTKRTGLNARDPATVPQQIDFAMEEAAKGGWGPWHGWKGNRWAGINQTQVASGDKIPRAVAKPDREASIPKQSAPEPTPVKFDVPQDKGGDKVVSKAPASAHGGGSSGGGPGGGAIAALSFMTDDIGLLALAGALT